MALAWLAPAAIAAPPKPNIVLIVSDDQEVALTAFMPKLNELVIGRGASFTHAYYNVSMCCPSRATILTGRYAQNTKVIANSHALFYNAGDDKLTIAVWLQAAGYRTGLVGKYLNGYPHPAGPSYIPPGWDYWAARIAGGVAYYNYTLNENGTAVSYGSEAKDYATDLYTDKAMGFIERSVADQRPFFLRLNAPAPHLPSTPAPRHAEMYADLMAERPPSFREEDVGDKPSFLRETTIIDSSIVAKLQRSVLANFGQMPLLTDGLRFLRRNGLLSVNITGNVDGSYRERVRTLLAVDDSVGRIIDRLAALGSLDNTYVVYVSDNGWIYGQHRLRGKGLPYEEVIRMPLYVRGPGIAPHVELAHLVGNVDLASTIADWAGARIPEGVDGRSFAPLLRSGAPEPELWRQAYPLAFSPSGDEESEEWPGWQGVRTRDYTFAEYDTGDRELYDNRQDPYQLDNLASRADPALMRRLETLSTELATCASAGCRQLEDDNSEQGLGLVQAIDVLPAGRTGPRVVR